MLAMSRPIYVAQSPDVAARKLGDEMLIMYGRNSTLFILDDMATLIWEAADGLTTLDELVERNICSAFEVRLDEALRDAEELTGDLAKHGVILISEAPIRPANPVRGDMR
jgi:Coenzyme PQQ synthesis protein D (PqqD)